MDPLLWYLVPRRTRVWSAMDADSAVICAATALMQGRPAGVVVIPVEAEEDAKVEDMVRNGLICSTIVVLR